MSEIVTAWAEKCRGPGWSNRPIWYLHYVSGVPTVDAIQPQDQTEEMHRLFNICEAANDALLLEVRKAVGNE